MRWAGCVASAAEGLQSVLSAATLPFELIQSAALERRFDRFLMAEGIRGPKSTIPLPGEVAIDDDERERLAYERADRRMNDFMSSKEGSDYFRDTLVHEMNHRLRSQGVRTAAEELMVQTLISSWSVFESFSRSFIISAINENPRMAEPVLRAPDLRDVFGKQVVDLQTIGDHGFDLSSSMGSILFKNRRLDSLGNIRSVMKALLDSSEVQTALGQELWLLNQRRHLLVHNRGIIDAEYCKNTGDKGPIGAKLKVTATDAENSLTAVRDAILAVCRAAQSLGQRKGNDRLTPD